MPPKRVPKSASAATATPTRASRSRTKAAAAAVTESPDAKSSSGKRKRTEAMQIDTDSASDMELQEAKVKTKVVSKKIKKKAIAPFTKKACEKWFEILEDIETPGHITYNTILKWLEDLEVAPEGVVFYIIAWKCRAKLTYVISKSEFLTGMTALGVDSNEALLRKLPKILKETSPSFANETFDDFYKFCFNYFKPADAKNLEREVGAELYSGLLDPDRYSLTWIPTQSDQEPGETKGDFPHRKAFVKFLNQEPYPVQVITRDQYEQFVPFNRDVPWNLEGFKEEESSWPTLMDTYIAWKRVKYPLPEKNGEAKEE